MPYAATWMQLEIIILSEESKKEKDKWYQLDVKSEIRHKWNYLQNRNILIDIENRLVVATWSGEGENELGFWC